MKRRISALGIVLLAVSSLASGQSVERNVVYGMYSGAGLSMDVYRPAQSNGIAIIAIQGSEWYSPMRYDAAPLGTLGGKGDASDSDPVNRLDAKVQAVVALFAPADLASMFSTTNRPGTLSSLMGFAYQDPALPPGVARSDDFENRQYREASPITHVTADDAPMLLIQGDRDVVVPLKQSEVMEAALKAAHVQVTLIRVPGGKHGPNFQLPAGDPRLPDHVGEAVRWFNTHVKGGRASLRPTSSVRFHAPNDFTSWVGISLGSAVRNAR